MVSWGVQSGSLTSTSGASVMAPSNTGNDDADRYQYSASLREVGETVEHFVETMIATFGHVPDGIRRDDRTTH